MHAHVTDHIRRLKLLLSKRNQGKLQKTFDKDTSVISEEEESYNSEEESGRSIPANELYDETDVTAPENRVFC